MNSLRTNSLILLACSSLAGCYQNTNQIDNEEKPIMESTTPVTEVFDNHTISRTNSAERKVLTRLVRNLEEIEALVDEAQFRANPDDRFRFDYRQLRNDLTTVREGIHAYIRLPIYSPRTIELIPGNYGK